MFHQDFPVPSREGFESDFYDSDAEICLPSEEHSEYCEGGDLMGDENWGSEDDCRVPWKPLFEEEAKHDGSSEESEDSSMTPYSSGDETEGRVQCSEYVDNRIDVIDLTTEDEEFLGREGKAGHSPEIPETIRSESSSTLIRDIEETPREEDTTEGYESGGAYELRKQRYKRLWDKEVAKEREVLNALFRLEAACKVGQVVPLGPIEDGIWDLYSTSYLDECPTGSRSNKSIAFGHFWQSSPEFRCEDDQVVASIQIYPAARLNVYPLYIPRYAHPQPVILDSQEGHITSVIFLGNGYLKLGVESHIINGTEPIPRAVGEPPKEVLEFSGIFRSSKDKVCLEEEDSQPFPSFT
jgi:hypothetical protein